MVTVDVVSTIVMSNVLNHVVCTGVDDEIDCVKSFSCGCNTLRLCCSQLTQEFILRRRLDKKELNEGAILISMVNGRMSIVDEWMSMVDEQMANQCLCSAGFCV